jgi:hypothetical protein
MMESPKFRRTTKNIIDDILDYPDLSFALAAGAFKDTGALAKLNKESLVHILNDVKIRTKDLNRDLMLCLARYVVQAEYQRRNGQIEKSMHTLQHLEDAVRVNGVQILTAESYEEFAEEENTMTDATETTTNNATTTKAAGHKAAKKTAGKKADKKAAKKAAPKGKTKEQRKKEAEERKSRLESQIVHLKKMPSEDDLPLQAYQICKVLKAKGGKMVVSTLVANLEGVVKTKQSLMSIWSFYRARLIDKGFVKIEDAR